MPSPRDTYIIRASTTDDEIDAALPYLDMRKEAKERRDDAAAVIEEQGDQVVLELHHIGGADVLWSKAFGYALVNDRTGGIDNSRLLTAADDGCRSPEDAAEIWRTGAADLRTLRGLLTQALALRAAPKWPLPGCDDTAKESEKWWRAVEAALGPNVGSKGLTTASAQTINRRSKSWT